MEVWIGVKLIPTFNRPNYKSIFLIKTENYAYEDGPEELKIPFKIL